MKNSKSMVDISAKDITVRTATAGGCVVLGEEVFEALRDGKCPKGDVL